MKTVFKFLAYAVLSAGLFACAEKNTNFDFPHEISDLTPDENVVYGKLPNGVRYAVLENDTPSKTASLRMRFSTGSLNETDDQRGLAHFLEHMAFNGSKSIPEGEMVKRLERFGLSFGADTNAYTSFDETVYMLELPEVSDEILNETLFIMRETAEHLLLEQDAIDRERGVVQSEKRRNDSPGARASLAQLEFLTRGSRISDRLPIGTDETLAAMGSESFRSYYDGYYRPENTFIVLVGDMDTGHAAQKIEEYFGDWKTDAPPLEAQTAGMTPPRKADIGYFSDPEIQTQITLATIKPFQKKTDTAENRKENFIRSMGNRILNRRLASLARQSDAGFIGGGAGAAFTLDTAEIMTLSMSSRPENWKQALAIGEQELRKALAYGFTQAELDEQIANSRKSMQIAVQTAETRRTPALAGGILGSFGAERVFTDPAGGLERFEAFASEITLDAVWAAFKEQWSGALDEPLLFLQTSLVLENPDAEIRAAYLEANAVEVKQNAQTAQAEFTYTEFGEPGKVAARRHIEDVDAHLVKFENGVLLNFKQTDFAKDSINIRAEIAGGSLSIPRKDAALQILASNMMSAGGLEAHSADDLQRIMAGKAVNAGFGFGSKAFIISGSTVPSDLADQFNLMTATLTAPGYREEAKSRFDKYIQSWYPTLDSTPDGVASRDVGRLVHSGDPRYGIPTQSELLGAKIEDVKSWLTPHFGDGRIEITVVGDIDLETVINETARTFGALPVRSENVDAYSDMTKLQFPNGRKKPVTLGHSGDDNRALLQVYWPAPDGTDIMRSRRLSVLRSIFSNRLTDVIREEESAAYSPSAGLSSSRVYPGYGYVMASLGITPEKAPDMIKVLDRIASAFQAGEISEDEFDRAIQPILENLDSSLENNGYWMNVIRNAQTDTWGLDNFRSREAAFQNMTLDDIKPLAAQIFKAENAYRVQILPEK